MIFYLYFCNIKTTIQTKEQSKGEKQPFFLFPIDSDELRESIGEENIPSWKEEPKEIKITIIFKPVKE